MQCMSNESVAPQSHYSSVLAKTYRLGRLTPSSIIQSRIMLLSSIDILMTQNIRYKVNITGFLVQGSTIGAAKLMRGDLFCSCDLPGIFFNQILDSLNTDPAALGRIEESVLMGTQMPLLVALWIVPIKG